MNGFRALLLVLAALDTGAVEQEFMGLFDHEHPAVAIEKEVQRLAAVSNDDGGLWPGFDLLSVPLAVFDGKRTFLFRHPSPPEGFEPFSADQPTFHVLQGRYEEITSNTVAEINGVDTATLMLDPALDDRPLRQVAALAIHEGFHAHQLVRHPDWFANEADLFVYPAEDAELLALWRLEAAALLKALQADDEIESVAWARKALLVREERFGRMEPAFPAYERGTELVEGLATYIEMRAGGWCALEFLSRRFGADEVRRRAYATGIGYALLLDRFKSGWQEEFDSRGDRKLDTFLTEALEPGRAAAFDEAFVLDVNRNAREDVAAMSARRAEMVKKFMEKPGWRVVVEVGSGELLRPRGFDPLNLERVNSKGVLHTRMLMLGNSSGSLRIFGAEALTEAAGPHPLFEGVRRVVVTGLPEPETSESDGLVTVSAPGLDMEMKGATVTRSDRVITVRID